MLWTLHPTVDVRLVNNPGMGWCGDFTIIDMWRARAGGPYANHGVLNLRWDRSPKACAVHLRRQARHPALLAQFLAEHGGDVEQGQGSVRDVLWRDGWRDNKPT